MHFTYINLGFNCFNMVFSCFKLDFSCFKLDFSCFNSVFNLIKLRLKRCSSSCCGAMSQSAPGLWCCRPVVCWLDRLHVSLLSTHPCLSLSRPPPTDHTISWAAIHRCHRHRSGTISPAAAPSAQQRQQQAVDTAGRGTGSRNRPPPSPHCQANHPVFSGGGMAAAAVPAPHSSRPLSPHSQASTPYGPYKTIQKSMARATHEWIMKNYSRAVMSLKLD